MSIAEGLTLGLEHHVPARTGIAFRVDAGAFKAACRLSGKNVGHVPPDAVEQNQFLLGVALSQFFAAAKPGRSSPHSSR